MSEVSRKFPTRAQTAITTLDSFRAMVVFLEAFWERDGRPDDSLMKLLAWVSPVDDAYAPADPAMWQDWLEAIDKIWPAKLS